MRAVDLGVLYAVVGVGCGVAVLRLRGATRPADLASAALAVVLWPLWAPFALVRPDGEVSGAGRGAARGAAPESVVAAVRRIAQALREGVDATRGTPLGALLPEAAAARILAEVERVAARHAELDALLRTAEFDVARALARVQALERQEAPARMLATARLHHDNVARLARLRDRDARALDELADLAGALRTQLVLAAYAGSTDAGASGIVSELCARVEGLSAAIDAAREDDAGDGRGRPDPTGEDEPT
jgi:hypothetical protein